ncbi:DUF4124 domain-containing protein [Chromobacterium amazonense]|uniref:DUF4124 domain-containing protein n=1 Tax=Chromobacterium amazonense TaxID=1382803 RepID=UPI003F791FC3
MHLWMLVGMLLLSSSGLAEIFKCREPDGRIAYSQQACPLGSQRIEMNAQPFSVVEQDERDRAATQRYRRDLADWLGKREKAQQKAEAVAERERREARKKWLAERERCRRLGDKQRALSEQMRQAASRKAADRVQMRLARVEDQMQDRACHLYKED